MVARDHHHAHAGAAAFGHGGRDVGAQRIGQRHEADEAQAQRGRVVRPGTGRRMAAGHREHAQAVARQRGRGGERGGLLPGGGAQLRDRLRRALGGGDGAAALEPDAHDGGARRSEAVFALQAPDAGPLRLAAGGRVQGEFDRIGAGRPAGQQREVEHFALRRRHGAGAAAVVRGAVAPQ